MKKSILVPAIIFVVTFGAYQASFALDSVAGQWTVQSVPTCESGRSIYDIRAEEFNKGMPEAPSKMSSPVEISGSVEFDQTSKVQFEITTYARQTAPKEFTDFQINQAEGSKAYIEQSPDNPLKESQLATANAMLASLQAMRDGFKCTLRFTGHYSGTDKDFNLQLADDVTSEDCPDSTFMSVQTIARKMAFDFFRISHASVDRRSNGRLIITGGPAVDENNNCAVGDRSILTLKEK